MVCVLAASCTYPGEKHSRKFYFSAGAWSPWCGLTQGLAALWKPPRDVPLGGQCQRVPTLRPIQGMQWLSLREGAGTRPLPGLTRMRGAHGCVWRINWTQGPHWAWMLPRKPPCKPLSQPARVRAHSRHELCHQAPHRRIRLD